MPAILILVLAIVVVAVVLVVVGLRNPQASNDRILADRLEEFSQTGQQFDLEELEMAAPFTERIVYPVAVSYTHLTLPTIYSV